MGNDYVYALQLVSPARRNGCLAAMRPIFTYTWVSRHFFAPSPWMEFGVLLLDVRRERFRHGRLPSSAVALSWGQPTSERVRLLRPEWFMRAGWMYM